MPDPRLDVLAKLAEVRRRSSRRGSTFVDIAGLVRAPRKARGSATSSSPISARSTPSPMWCAASRTPTSPMSRQDRSGRRHRDGRDRADAGRSRQPRAARRCAREEGQGQRQGSKETLDLVNRSLALLREGKPARLVERKAEEEKRFTSLGLLTSKPVLYVCNVEEGVGRDRQRLFSRQVEARAEEEAPPPSSSRPRSKPRSPCCRATSAPIFSRRRA